MARGARRNNASVGGVIEEAEQNLWAAFKKSARTNHRGLKGDARAENIANFLQSRLPSGYRVACKGEIVDYLDNRSGEMDILIIDQIRNPVLSEDPLWIPAESLLAYVEVKSVLTKEELRKSYLSAEKLNALRPFRRVFTLAGAGKQAEGGAPADGAIRCFRTLFAYTSDLTEEDWLAKEWRRIVGAASETQSKLAFLDRVLVLDRGLINPPSATGTDQIDGSSILGQWFSNLVNFLARENGRRPALDWQNYAKTSSPGWKKLTPAVGP